VHSWAFYMYQSGVVRIIRIGSFFALPLLLVGVLLLVPITSLQRDRIIADSGEALLAELVTGEGLLESGELPPGPFLRLSVQPAEEPVRLWTGPAEQKNRAVMIIRQGQDTAITSWLQTARLLFSDKAWLIQVEDQQPDLQLTYLMRSEALRAPLLEIALIYAASMMTLFAI
jgi:hypothetical protein